MSRLSSWHDRLQVQQPAGTDGKVTHALRAMAECGGALSARLVGGGIGGWRLSRLAKHDDANIEAAKMRNGLDS